MARVCPRTVRMLGNHVPLTITFPEKPGKQSRARGSEAASRTPSASASAPTSKCCADITSEYT
eukprot:1297350-Prymnesium_polylepis.1